METVTLRAGGTSFAGFDPVERLILLAIAVMFAACVPMAYFGNGAIDAGPYWRVSAILLVLVGVGQFYRISNRSQNIAAALIATALMVGFSNVASMFNYLLMPIDRPVLDPWLIKLDAALGFYWPDAVAYAGQFPVFNTIIGLAYGSLLPQIILLLLILGFMGKRIWLQRLMLIFVVTAIPMICFWAIFPSHGPSAFYTLSPEVMATTRPFVTPEYGASLVAMLRDGPGLITPANIKGLIAFPSYHICMAMICAYCARGSKYLFWPLLVVNILVIPGTVVHGGHHLVDLIAGAGLFVGGVWATNRILASLHREPAATTQ